MVFVSISNWENEPAGYVENIYLLKLFAIVDKI